MSTVTDISTKPSIPPKLTWKPDVLFKGKVKVAQALYKYTAQREDELSFDEGDLLYIYENSNEPNWYKAKCGDFEGLIPANYVREHLSEIELPLHDAARRGNLTFLRDCLKRGVSPTGLDAVGNTALYWAARAGHIDCMREILNITNAGVNVQNKMGDTALHVAAVHGHLNIVNLLLENGADPSILNNDNLTAEKLSSDQAIKNSIQIRQQNYKITCEFDGEDYNDDSD